MYENKLIFERIPNLTLHPTLHNDNKHTHTIQGYCGRVNIDCVSLITVSKHSNQPSGYSDADIVSAMFVCYRDKSHLDQDNMSPILLISQGSMTVIF